MPETDREAQAWLPIPRDGPRGSWMMTLLSSALGLGTRGACLLWYCLVTRTQVPMGQRGQRGRSQPPPSVGPQQPPPPGAQWDQVEPEHQGQRMLSREPIWGSTAFTMSAGLPIRHALLGTGLTPILLPPKSSPVNPSGVPDLTFMCVPV